MSDLPEEDSASPEEPVKGISFGENQTELSDADLQLLLKRSARGELTHVDIRNFGTKQLEDLMFTTSFGSSGYEGKVPLSRVLSEMMRRLQPAVGDADVFLSDSQARINQLEMEDATTPKEIHRRRSKPDETSN